MASRRTSPRTAFALLVALTLTWPASVLAANISPRVALIIGNDDYRDLQELRNAVNDARAMDRALRELGFQTAVHTNATRREMHHAVSEFGRKMSSDTVALFFYAGHGIQSDGQNYLVPVDAKLRSSQDLRVDAVDAQLVLAEMKDAGNRMNIMILDACRDNPLPEKGRSAARGLAAMSPPRGTLVAFSAGPGERAQDGQPGSNGLYTGKLLEALSVPGLKVEEVFKRVARSVYQTSGGEQEPWIQASLRADFYFNPGAGEGGEPAPAKADTPVPDRPGEAERAYEAAIAVGDCGSLEAFIEAFPDSFYSRLAKQRAAESCAPEPAQAAVPAPRSSPVTTSPGNRASTARFKMENLRNALDMFQLDVGRYPTTTEGLEALTTRPPATPRWAGPYLRPGTVLLDPWGAPYSYRNPGPKGESFEIRSYGADGRAGGTGEAADIHVGG